MGCKVEAALLLFVVGFLGLSNAQRQCYTPNRQVGNCINLKQCRPLVNILINPDRQQSDIQFLRDSQCGFEGVTPKVCCPGYTRSSFVPQVPKGPILPTDCGLYTQSRIVGGNITSLDEHPWLVLIEYSSPSELKTGCAGALISKRYVLTAAHCVKGKTLPKEWRLRSVRLGEWNTATNPDCVPEGNVGKKCNPPVVIVYVEEQIVHENYNTYSGHEHYDIALLRLNRDVEFTDYIKPICLPNSSKMVSKFEAAGWGTTENKKQSDIKLKVRLPLADMQFCQTKYRSHQRIIGDRQFCAGGQTDVDTCNGDSGGPLMQMHDGPPPYYIPRWTAVGIVSFGPRPCGSPNFPGVYTKVYDYVPWINGKLRA